MDNGTLLHRFALRNVMILDDVLIKKQIPKYVLFDLMLPHEFSQDILSFISALLGL